MDSTLENCSSSLADRNYVILENMREFDFWARRLARRGFEYEDALNDIILRSIPDIRSAKVVSNWGALVFVLARNSAFKVLRDSNARKRGKKEVQVDVDGCDIMSDEFQSDCLMIRNAFNLDLTDRERDILNRHYFNDEDVKDIANSWGVTKSAATAYHNSLKSKLRSIIGGER